MSRLHDSEGVPRTALHGAAAASQLAKAALRTSSDPENAAAGSWRTTTPRGSESARGSKSTVASLGAGPKLQGTHQQPEAGGRRWPVGWPVEA